MQEEMASEEHKLRLKELIDMVINDGHVSLLESALNNATTPSHTSFPSKTTRVVRFLVDGGANTCLTKYFNRLFKRSKPKGKSTGAGGLSLQPTCEGFIKFLAPGIQNHIYLRAVAVDSADPNSYEILAQPLLQRLGYAFLFAEEGACMISPDKKVQHLVKDPKSGLWMIDLPIEINTSSDIDAHVSNIENEDAEISRLGMTIAEEEEDVALNTYGSNSQDQDEQMDESDEESDESTDESTDESSDESTHESSNELTDIQNLPQDLRLLAVDTNTNYFEPTIFFSANANKEHSYLSDTYLCTITIDGNKFVSLEHFVIYRKAFIMRDTKTSSQILKETDLKQIRHLEKKIEPFVEEAWNFESYLDTLLEGGRIKFNSHPNLKENLLHTSPRPLAKLSGANDLSGIGYAVENEQSRIYSNWGANLLGLSLQYVRREIELYSSVEIEKYWHNVMFSDADFSSKIYKIKDESQAYSLQILLRKLDEHGKDIIDMLKSNDKVENNGWIALIFPTPFKDPDEELPKSYLERSMQNSFIESASDIYFEIIQILEQKIMDQNYDLLEIFEPRHIRRIRTFAKWFSEARKTAHVECPTDRETEFLYKKNVFMEFLQTLKYSLWPSAPNHISLRKKLLRIEGLDEEKSSSVIQPNFKLFFDNEKKESSDPKSKHYHAKFLNNLTGRTCYQSHCDLGHISDEVLFRTLDGSKRGFKGDKTRILNCPVCQKIRISMSHKPAFSMKQNWSTPVHDTVHRDVHGPIKTLGFNGEKFFEIYVSASCRMVWVFCMRRKSEVVENFRKMADIFESRKRKIVRVIGDNAQEYLSKEMKSAMKAHGAISQQMPEYIKDGNLAEVFMKTISSKIMANIMGSDRAPPKAWTFASGLSAKQANATICLSAPHSILHYVTPSQIWSLPNSVISEFYNDLLHKKLSIEKVMLTVDANDLSFFRRFWSLATVCDPDKKIGQLNAGGRAKSGTYVYIGPADDHKPSFKLLDLSNFQIFESAHVTLVEDAAYTKDLLTNIDIVGPSNLSQSSKARQIRDSFRSTDEVPSDLLAEEEYSTSESTSNRNSTEDIEDDDENEFDDRKEEANGDMEAENNSSDGNIPTDSTHSIHDDKEQNDYELEAEIRNREKNTEALPDHEIRKRKDIGEKKGVRKKSKSSSGDTHENEEENDIGNDEENDAEFLRRYRKANLPISYEQHNPKKKKTLSFERYKKYRNASTIDEAMKLEAKWEDIVWDYKRGFLKCLRGIERRRLNSLVQRCLIESDLELDYPQIDEDVMLFNVDPNDKAWGKTGKLIKMAPQIAQLSQKIYTIPKDDSDSDGSSLEEEDLDTATEYPIRQSLFRTADPQTDGISISYFDSQEQNIPYVPAIHQLTNEFSTDLPPTISDANLHSEDQLYIFETTTDDGTPEHYVSSLKAFTTIPKELNEQSFISRPKMIDTGTKYIESLFEKIEDRHEWITQREEDLPTLRNYVNAISESTRLLSKTFGKSPHYIHETTKDTVIPKNFDHAMDIDVDGKWNDSMYVEMEQLIRLKTWVLIPSSELKGNQNITGTCWAYRVKGDGRHRSRLCAQGFSMRFGLDYWETYSSVATTESIRVAIALAAANKRRLKTFDVKNAFQNTPLSPDDYVVCKQPPGFEVHPADPDESNQTLIEWYKSLGLKIPESKDEQDTFHMEIHAALQGLKSSSRCWQKYLFAWLTIEGFKQLKSDDCCWVYTNDNGIDIAVYCYVDDILCSSSDETSEQYFEEIFYKRWEGSTGSGGLATALLGMNIHHYEDQGCIVLNNEIMIDDIAVTFKVTEGTFWKTPMSEKFDPKYDPNEEDLDTSTYNYRSLCGALLFVVTHTRPDCACACSMICSAMAKPQMKHWLAAKRLARYLYLTKTLGLCYRQVDSANLNKIHAYVDASWAAESGARSRAGYMIKLNGSTVCYRSKLINTICLSSAEAETTAAVACLKDIIWLRLHLWELDYPQPGSTCVYEDNSATISSASGNSQKKESRYYQMRTEFIRQLVKTGVVYLTYITTKNQAADALSKNLAPNLFDTHQPTILGVQPLKAMDEHA